MIINHRSGRCDLRGGAVRGDTRAGQVVAEVNEKKDEQESAEEPSVAYCLRGLEWRAQCANFQLRKLNVGIFWIAAGIWMIVTVLWCCFFCYSRFFYA